MSRPSAPRRTAVGALLCLATWLAFPGRASADGPTNGANVAAAATEEPQPPKILRIVVSPQAADKLSEGRVRRLIELQVGGGISIPDDGWGRLDEHSIRVFIDLVTPTMVIVQVQAPDRKLETRNVDVAGLPWEVATRFVAIAVSQSVRAQLAPPRKPKPRPPTDDEIAAELASHPTVELSAGLEGVYASDVGTGLFGSRLTLSFHQPVLSESISVGLLGSFEGGLWADFDVAAFHRFWIGPDLRIGAGLGFALAVTDGIRPTTEETELWVRPHALAAIDFRMTPKSWFAIGIDPGMTVDPRREEVGLWLGGSLRIEYEGR